jgi:DHA2 family multidrug resistance protein-like MFS transporter
VQSELTKSFDGAVEIAKQYPQYQNQIVSAAKESFIHGQDWAFASGLIAVALGAVVVAVFFPHAKGEKELLAEYQRLDAARPDHAPTATGPGG